MDGGVAEKAKYLLQLPGASDRLKLFSANLLEPGSFDEVVAGCDGVFHVATPISAEAITDPQVSSSPFNVFGCCFFQDSKFLTSLYFLVLKNYMLINPLLSVYWGEKHPISFQLSHME
jgi:hypothetical protein